MGVVLKIQQKIVCALFILITILLGFFYVGVTSVHAATIIRPPNNLGLVGYWSLDEGRGTQASDLSGNGNNGVLNGGPAWTTGKSRGALSFDGVNDYVTTVNNLGLSGDVEVTISNWVRWDGASWSSNFPASVSGNPGTSNRGLSLTYSGGRPAIDFWSHRFRSATALSLGGWHHVVVTKTPGPISTTSKIYIDGQEVAGLLEGSNTTPNVIDNVLQIGRLDGTRWFNGAIDEVRIYNRALSASEVLSLYTNTKSTIVGVTPTDRHNNGLVGHWTFDGKHTTATIAEDVAGSNDGTIFGAVPARGIIGQAMEFDGSGDYIDIGDVLDQTGSFSISVWLKARELNALHKRIVVKDNGAQGWALSFGDPGMNNLRFFIREVTPVTTDTGAVITEINRWYHVAAVFDTDTNTKRIYVDGEIEMEHTSTTGDPVDNTASLRIANSSPNFNGTLDDVRIYNRALSANEIAGLYSATSSSKMQSSTDELVTSGLAGHWTFDTGTISGTSAEDISGNEKDGTIIGTQPSVVSGKIREALAFNGTSGYINFLAPLSSPDDWTYAFWFYPTGAPSTDTAGLVGQANNPRVTFQINQTVSTGATYLAGGAWAGGTGSTPLAFNNWYQVTAVWRDASSSAPTHDLYINGSLVGSRTYPAAIVAPFGTHHVNRRDSNSTLQSLVDDVRIYNRALTEEEITQLYSMGQ